jgi:hypothetical protein
VRITNLSRLIAAAAVATLCFAALARGVGAGTVHCLAASTGPGSLHRGGTAGARCMLAEYRDHCHAADYVLSSFGVDTVHQETFRVGLQSGRCRLVVTETFRVVPQQQHMVGMRTCTRLRPVGTDVVADRCTRGPPATISLTRLT